MSESEDLSVYPPTLKKIISYPRIIDKKPPQALYKYNVMPIDQGVASVDQMPIDQGVASVGSENISVDLPTIYQEPIVDKKPPQALYKYNVMPIDQGVAPDYQMPIDTGVGEMTISDQGVAPHESVTPYGILKTMPVKKIPLNVAPPQESVTPYGILKTMPVKKIPLYVAPPQESVSPNGILKTMPVKKIPLYVAPAPSSTCPPPNLSPIINAFIQNIIPFINSIPNITILQLPRSSGKNVGNAFNKYITGPFKKALQEIQQQLPCNDDSGVWWGGKSIKPMTSKLSKCGALSRSLYTSIANSFNEHIDPIITDILENENANFQRKKIVIRPYGQNLTQTIVDYINGPLKNAISIIQSKLPCPESNTSNESNTSESNTSESNTSNKSNTSKKSDSYFGGRRKTKRLAMKRRKTKRLAMKKSKKSLRRRRS